jgi:large subunit ribosomal protein L5
MSDKEKQQKDKAKKAGAEKPKADEGKKAKAPQVKDAAAAKEQQKKEPKAAAVKEDLGNYRPRLIESYRKQIVPQLMKRFSYTSPMQVPRLEKIVVNMGVGDAVEDQKLIEHAVDDMTVITGQKPQVTRAKKSISNFKLRKSVPIGCRVTLRRWHMYEFLDRFISLAVPRIRDFRGLNDRSFDGRGNYSIGLKEQIIFPEINYDKVDKVRGMNITFVTTAPTDEEAYELLQAFGMPFRKRQ